MLPHTATSAVTAAAKHPSSLQLAILIADTFGTPRAQLFCVFSLDGQTGKPTN